MKDTILIVDDNEDVRAFVRASLESESYRVVEAADGDTAMLVFARESPSVVILDIGIGQPDGFEVCRLIRTESNVPVIMLTNRADDYIRKPVSPRILSLRVGNQLRRRGIGDGKEITLLKAGGLTLDLMSHELRLGDAIVPLTRTEFDFIELLMQQPKRVFTREQVISAIGGSSEYSSDHLLDTHASRLRIKIKGAGGPKVISAVRAVGYKLFYPDSEPVAVPE